MKREQIKRKAIAMAKKSGLINLSVRGLCEQAGIPEGSFAHVMGCTFSDFIDELSKEYEETKVHKPIKTRTHPHLRRAQIVLAGVKIAKRRGLDKITREEIAQHVGLSTYSIRRYFNTINDLKQAIQAAI